jgi:hypothetical protein
MHERSIGIGARRRVTGRRRLWSLLALSVVGCMAWFGFPTTAQAGGYRVIECSPSAPAAPEVTFNRAGADSAGWPTYSGDYICPMTDWWTVANNGLKVAPSNPGHTGSNGSWAAWEIKAPVGTHFKSASWGYMLCNDSWGGSFSSTWGAFTATYSYMGGSQAVPSQYSPISPGRGCNSGEMNVTGASDRAGLLIQCQQPQCLANQGVWGKIGAFNFVINDPEAPRVASLHGSLLAGGPRAGMQRLEIAATDQGAGVREAAVRVNGSEIARPPGSCSLIPGGSAGNRLVPCPQSIGFSLNTDTARGPWHEGQNTVQVCVFEYATENAPGSECRSHTVLIDNSCVDSRGAVGQGTQLTGGLARNALEAPAPRLLVRSDESATIRGTLSGSGSAVGAANICLYEQIDAPAEIRQLAQVTKTRSDGGFALQIPAGPSRAYDVVYRNDSSVLERRSLYLEAVAVPNLQVSKKKLKNRKAVGFYGEIPGPRAGHRTVGLQALAGKKCRKKGKKGGKRRVKPKGPRCRLKWRTFKVLTTNNEGRFAGKYRFTQTRGKVRYRFRAAIAKQNGYPYAPGVSAEQQVRVRGKKLRRR